MSVTLLSRRLENLCLQAQMASHNSNMKVRLGACVLFRGKLIHLGSNSNNRSRLNGAMFPAVHAEVDVVNKFVQSNCKNTRHMRRSYPQGSARPKWKKVWCRLQGYIQEDRSTCCEVYCQRTTCSFPSMQPMPHLYGTN